MSKLIGVLTSGGDTPGLNAALRAVGKAAELRHGMQVIGFRDGFRGLMENRTIWLDDRALSGILTHGGTILGTSRDKPYAMPVAGKVVDMTDLIVENYRKHHLDALVCLGGGGTQKNAFHLVKAGLNVVTLPKTIDNDVAMTDVTFGFDTALGIATEAVDRLHSTAHSHHRIIVVEVMGHKAGWLALGAGVAGGADVILIPEIPYDVEVISAAILKRFRSEKRFSIVAVAEGALSLEQAAAAAKAKERDGKKATARPKERAPEGEGHESGRALGLARKLEERTGLESRVTILGHLQRGGTPSAADRFLATRLGTACADLVAKRKYGVMVAAHGEGTRPVPLGDVVGKRKTVPPDHPWVAAARAVGTCLGD
ncbi:MAG: 6-phosphofructokinase [Thermoanaerobaculia bacterium]|nr:6-phosphofructokinase [Thermoanaerobaculia bacterium]